MRVLALAPRAEASALTLEARRLHPHHPVRTIVALRDSDDPAAVVRAMDDAWVDEALSSASLATLVAQRARCTPEASALPRTRRDALLQGSLAPPALRLAHAPLQPQPPTTSEPAGLSPRHAPPPSTTRLRHLEPPLASLQRALRAEPSAALATQAADTAWSPVDSLARRMAGAADVRRARATTSRRRVARFPVLKTLEQCRWDWPPRLHRLQGHHHCRLACLQDTVTRIVLGGVGLGTTPRATALGSAACLQGHAGCCARASEVIHTLSAATHAGRRTTARTQDTQPALRILDELGDRPIDTTGAALRCHVLALRDAQGALILTSHRALQAWPALFPHDRTLTSAVLDRLLHHADTILIAGQRVRMQDHIERSTSPHGVTGSTEALPATPCLTWRLLHVQTAHFPTFSRNR
jgi:DNA replication protein DnaC